MEHSGSGAPTRTVPALMRSLDEVEDAQQALDVRVRTGLGINAVDCAVLRWVDRVHRRGGSSRVGDITDHFGVSSGSATEIVHRLTRAGLLRRQAHPTDARVRSLVPTDRAGERLEHFVGLGRRDLDLLLTSMSPEEQQRAAELLEAVRRILSAAPGDAGG